MAKKSFNPLKMWGSYVGLVIGIIIGWLMSINAFKGGESFSGWIVAIFAKQILRVDVTTAAEIAIGLGFVVFIGIIGFLIGYGIHAIVRATK